MFWPGFACSPNLYDPNSPICLDLSSLSLICLGPHAHLSWTSIASPICRGPLFSFVWELGKPRGLLSTSWDTSPRHPREPQGVYMRAEDRAAGANKNGRTTTHTRTKTGEQLVPSQRICMNFYFVLFFP